MNRRARPRAATSRKRDYLAANVASRSMRWTGVVILLFLIFHLADLTWGTVNPDFVRGDVYRNLVASFERPAVAAIYIVANIALGIHLFHGAWSMFQSLGLNNPRWNAWRRGFAAGFAGIVMIGNLSFPIAVLTGVVSADDNPDCARRRATPSRRASCTPEEDALMIGDARQPGPRRAPSRSAGPSTSST